MPHSTESDSRRRVGAWLVGARGSVATCVAYGLAGLREGLLEPVGLATAHAPLARLPFTSLEDMVLGGHDVCRRSLTESAGELVRSNVLSNDLVTACSDAAGAFENRIRPGILDDADVGVADLDGESARLGGLAPREQVAHLTADLEAFRSSQELDRVVVVHLASTEIHREPRAEWESLEQFEAALDAGQSQPASILYAYAALQAGCPYVNFTPSPGASIPALSELATESGLPHSGNDGKTGETLLKTVLAPMFVARRLRVLAWQGYNMLGNRDGEVLSEPLHREAKLRNKDAALREILGDASAHTHVGIDYVPSLADWKTAFDLIHFEGFLGARMSLSLTWTGSDSALAAPLVLDLVRLADFAAHVGESGAMEHTACYFKSPVGGGTHAFHEQFERLCAYAARHVR